MKKLLLRTLFWIIVCAIITAIFFIGNDMSMRFSDFGKVLYCSICLFCGFTIYIMFYIEDIP